MIITIQYSIEMDDEDIKKIKNNLNRKPSLTPYHTVKDYLKDRMEGIAVTELQQEYDENIGIKCKQRYFEIHTY